MEASGSGGWSSLNRINQSSEGLGDGIRGRSIAKVVWQVGHCGVVKDQGGWLFWECSIPSSVGCGTKRPRLRS